MRVTLIVKKRLNLIDKIYKANKIIELVNGYFNVQCNVVYKTKDVITPRQIAIYLIHKNIFMSTTEIGKLFKSKSNKHLDHATILHAKNKIKDFLTIDKEIIKNVNELKDDAKKISELSKEELAKFKIKEEILEKINSFDIKKLNEFNQNIAV